MMQFPTTPEEAEEWKEKIAKNDQADDWVTPIFSLIGISQPIKIVTDRLLKKVGHVQLKPK